MISGNIQLNRINYYTYYNNIIYEKYTFVIMISKDKQINIKHSKINK